MQELNKKLFGGYIKILVYTEHPDTEKILQKTYTEGLRLQKIFNFYDPESELSQLNQNKKAKVSPELLSVIKTALNYCIQTQGAYDITLGKVIAKRKKGLIVKTHCSYKDVAIQENTVIFNNPEVQIDLGSIAKGFVVDCLIEYLQKNGIAESLIDARGDIRVCGMINHVLGIQHPRQEGIVGSLKLNNQAVATSGDYEQFVGSFQNSHIVNQQELASVTVVAKTLQEADVFATALFVTPRSQREKLLKENSQLQTLTVDVKEQVRTYNQFEKTLTYEN
ncbi:MAG: hypothetical protein A2233_00660 [Candidatus Kerfeldbacteria bacterium RIFOXYA2_FULL_38_24]|uniref:FAD:protein FMN transferase n=1 Tax=Candidatus Kerfeldbacteria bacterium RIFOXYB2_FULL_38_14 TaxID=1798547 RepID=A0A1G2BD67_9BACT|nr:MAG: hypothetical protein A2233_00660 [Candidatus Kerfeldbacteria bacterium RIFOXYA2_FULL_38_24]OGY86666.1 MAG: hypothetical protein A2319_02945 [Candidatus Kerfeldbacteria bacterium RIFOXYB2_FULL_38_14]